MSFFPRPLSFLLYIVKDKIEHGLERLVKKGIYEPVASSKWAAPIVPIIKDDGSIHICGDYRQTVNEVADYNKYPVPRT